MSRTIQVVTFGFVMVVAMGSGCVAQSPSTDGGGASAGPTVTMPTVEGKAGEMARTVTLVDSLAFEMCPAPVGDARVILFDARSWPAHRAAAVGNAPSLAGWTPDFAKQSILLIAMGEKPTLGHGIVLAPPLQANGDKLTVMVNTKAPGPGALAAMAISSPCVYALIDMTDVARVDVFDGTSRELMQRWSR